MRPRPRAGVVWEQGEPVRLSRAHAIYWYRRPKLCSDTLIDLIADMEPQKQAEQGSDGAAKHADDGAANKVRVVVEGSCPFVQVAGSASSCARTAARARAAGRGRLNRCV